MTKQKCLSCAGIYDPDQSGGYYHACAPVLNTEGNFVEREDKRDENIDDSDRKNIKIKSEGKGKEKVVEGEGDEI